MKVRMLVTTSGAPDGIHVQEFQAGETYELPDVLAVPWLERGLAEKDKLGKGPSEVKDGAEAEDAAGDRADKPRRGKGPFKGRRG